MKLRIPSLILQPLVENAIKHGVAAYTGAGTLVVQVAARDSCLVIRALNGCAAAAGRARDSTGIGLQHLRERLAMMYGVNARLDAGVNAEGAGQSVLNLPLQAAETPPPRVANATVPA